MALTHFLGSFHSSSSSGSKTPTIRTSLKKCNVESETSIFFNKSVTLPLFPITPTELYFKRSSLAGTSSTKWVSCIIRSVSSSSSSLSIWKSLTSVGGFTSTQRGAYPAPILTCRKSESVAVLSHKEVDILFRIVSHISGEGFSWFMISFCFFPIAWICAFSPAI